MRYPIFRGVLYADKPLGIQILSRGMAENVSHAEPYVVISITSPAMNTPKIAKSPNRKAVLRLVFEDVDNEERQAMSDDQANQVAEFVNEWLDEVKILVIHCEMGMSRSAAVGAAISKVVNGDDMLFYQFYTPNALVFRKVLEAFKDPYNGI